MSTTYPFTGYRQVDSFGPDEEYSSDTEEFYVTLDLGTVEPTLLPSSSTYRLVGLDTPTPFLQLSGSFFRGRHDTLLGSELLFNEGKNDSERNTRALAHVGVTERRIRFKEVQLRQKAPEQLEEAPAVGANSSHNGAQAEAAGHSLGRMIGSVTEPRSRKRKKRRDKGKGKEKETSPQDEGRDDAMDTT
ncbi:uncharacterized protein F5147DRAFT_720860 [Suillus discolor]|uniref:Transcription factor TFIIIC triple barrel domain-containing protein n=1 Tax=Suillus discolor TaxID=1912936 RepID=A0A9P7EX62_9AGAM|nr:uncharacterized protein F5147DRAFT_720860 [Suillus discolor]KAG2093522.1 hypothetical protein F5147DRAFT_720860 [Suillus discolor]